MFFFLTTEVTLKYGCNPHQKPSVIYSPLGSKLPFRVVNGTPGYINLLDACNAWQLVFELKQALGLPAAASFKHCSPAGAAVGTPLTAVEAAAYEIADPSVLSPTALAYVRARNADPMCSFGDFAAVSHVIDVATAKVFKAEVCDGIIAPGFEPEALEILKAKKKGGFIILQADESFIAPLIEFREVYGVTFSQRRNDALFTPDHLKKVVAGGVLSEEAKRDMVLASIAIKYTQSNSVGYAKNGQMIGVGAGQQSRVDCVKLAGRKVSVWYLRQHPKVQGLKFLDSVKRQDR
jgi:phosphoribosylaminoimidazolecarboxamide formyltransferase/IMP cyclohydrolase